MQAAYSKDPYTQVGAKIGTNDNVPLGSGYNGPPPDINDKSFSWARPDADTPADEVNKNDLVIHAEINAIVRSDKRALRDATLYITALPCKECMKFIVYSGIKRIVYMDFRSSAGGILQDMSQRKKALEIAKMGGVKIEKFKGSIGWIYDWVHALNEKGVFAI